MLINICLPLIDLYFINKIIKNYIKLNIKTFNFYLYIKNKLIILIYFNKIYINLKNNEIFKIK